MYRAELPAAGSIIEKHEVLDHATEQAIAAPSSASSGSLLSASETCARMNTADTGSANSKD